MFLHPRNDTVETRARIAALDVRADSLRRVLHPEPCLEDAQERLDLAGILCWRGQYRATMELVLPLNSEDFPAEVAFNARQLIGDNYYRHDQYDLASKHYHECLEQARRAGNDYWAARAEDGIGWVLVDVGHYTTGEYQEAEKIFARLEPMHRQRGEWGPEAMAIYGLSRAFAGMGKYGHAIELAHRAIAVLNANGGDYLLQLPLLQLANVHRDRGDFEVAQPFYEAAVDAADRSQDPYLQALTALAYGNQLKYQKQRDAAVELWRSVLGMVDELDFPRIGNEICSRLAKFAVDDGNYEEAYRRQVESQAYGNKVGVISTILSNQQMLLRDQMHESAQLEDALNYLRTGVEVTADGIFVLERQADGMDRDEFVIRFVNESAAAMMGNRPTNIIHVLIKSVWRTSSAALLLEPSLQVHVTGEPCTLDPVELEFDEGAKGWYAVKIAKIPSGVVWTVSDVSAREEMQREILAQRDRLSVANERLTALDREKSEMLGIAAHDLRSPIGNIRSLSELITTDDPESAELLQTIGEISDSLLTLIGNLLDVERIERGEMELELSEVQVTPVLTEVAAQFAAEAAHKGIELKLEVTGEPLNIRADESALRRILQNLISNALKFSPPGAPVWLRMGLNGARARFEIEDRGCGITEADRKRLFAKFAKLSARPTAGESSTGLGLSIVKRLVEAMGGQVGCDSEPGLGATFWIEFDSVPAKFKAAA